MFKKLRNIGVLSTLMVLCFTASVFAGPLPEYQLDEMTGQGTIIMNQGDTPIPLDFEIELKNFDLDAGTVDVKGEMEADKIMLIPMGYEFDIDDVDLKIIIDEQTAQISDSILIPPYRAGFVFVADATMKITMGQNESSIPLEDWLFVLHDGDQYDDEDYFFPIIFEYLDMELLNCEVETTWDY